jgi:uncharacterized protein (DUF58 family)
MSRAPAQAEPVRDPAGGDEAGLLGDDFLRRLEGMRLKARRLTGAPAGGRPARQRTPAADFVDHRPYSPGDDLRHVDWPALARHDVVQVKVGQVRQATRVDLLLDLSPSMGVPAAKRVLSRQLVAALGWMSLASGDRVVLRAFPGPVGAAWGPAAGPAAGPAYVRAVAELAPRDGTASPCEAALSRLGRDAPAGGLAIVVSDFWLSDDIDAALAGLPGPRWDVMLLHVLGRQELEPDLSGPVEVVDAESGETVQVAVDDEALGIVRAAVRRRIESLRALAGRRGASYALIPADWPVEQAVIPYLRRRALIVS